MQRISSTRAMNFGKNILTMKVVKHENGLHREVMESQFLKVFMSRLDKHLCRMVSTEMILLWVGVGRDDLLSPFFV